MDLRFLLRHARRTSGLSQRTVARRAGVPQSTVARIESGQIDPRASTLNRLLRACGWELGLERARTDYNGVDRTLIRSQLSRTPTQRLEANINAARFSEEVAAGRRAQ